MTVYRVENVCEAGAVQTAFTQERGDICRLLKAGRLGGVGLVRLA